MYTLMIVDETPSGEVVNEMAIPVESPTLTVKDIITSRVEAEVRKYNTTVSERFFGLVRPTDSEEKLNGFQLRKPREIDAEKQVYVALSAFQSNGFFVMIDDRQMEDLGQRVEIHPGIRVSFVKLTPLVGG